MHATSMESMRIFIEKYLDSDKNLTILDVGSYSVNGSYKELFKSSNWVYKGMDIEPGPNVDIVSKTPYEWGIDEKFDVVISGQCIEHVADLKLWFQQLKNIVKPDGIVCIIGPNNGFKLHRYPVDCWRIFPDGLSYMLKDICGFKIIECFIKDRDCIGIAKN